jgi:hypothetical protein
MLPISFQRLPSEKTSDKNLHPNYKMKGLKMKDRNVNQILLGVSSPGKGKVKWRGEMKENDGW